MWRPKVNSGIGSQNIFFIEFLPKKINDELFSWSLWMPTLLFLVGHLAVAEVDPRKEAEDPDVNEETL